MSAVLWIIGGVIFFHFLRRRMRRRKEAAAHHILVDGQVRDFIVDVLVDMDKEGTIGFSVKFTGPTEMKVSRHPELLYRIVLDGKEMSVMHAPKNGAWWVSYRPKPDDPRNLVRIYSRKHEMAPKLESFVNLLQGGKKAKKAEAA